MLVTAAVTYIRRYLNDLNEELMVNFVDEETPTGTINGSNLVFTLSVIPNPQTSIYLWLNGQLQERGIDYILSSATITMTAAPQTGDRLLASYRYST